MRGHGDPLRYAPRIFGINHLEDENRAEADLFFDERFLRNVLRRKREEGGAQPRDRSQQEVLRTNSSKAPPTPPLSSGTGKLAGAPCDPFMRDTAGESQLPSHAGTRSNVRT
jgi:hypothetical protein